MCSGSYFVKLPNISRTTPVTINVVIIAAKAYTGTANSRPASFIPRRLPNESSSNAPTVISRWYGPRLGTAETTATVPAEHWMATVTT